MFNNHFANKLSNCLIAVTKHRITEWAGISLASGLFGALGVCDEQRVKAPAYRDGTVEKWLGENLKLALSLESLD